MTSENMSPYSPRSEEHEVVAPGDQGTPASPMSTAESTSVKSSPRPSEGEPAATVLSEPGASGPPDADAELSGAEGGPVGC